MLSSIKLRRNIVATLTVFGILLAGVSISKQPNKFTSHNLSFSKINSLSGSVKIIRRKIISYYPEKKVIVNLMTLTKMGELEKSELSENGVLISTQILVDEYKEKSNQLIYKNMSTNKLIIRTWIRLHNGDVKEEARYMDSLGKPNSIITSIFRNDGKPSEMVWTPLRKNGYEIKYKYSYKNNTTLYKIVVTGRYVGGSKVQEFDSITTKIFKGNNQSQWSEVICKKGKKCINNKYRKTELVRDKMGNITAYKIHKNGKLFSYFEQKIEYY